MTLGAPPVRQTGPMRNVVILGSTGSIGTQALQVIAAHPARYDVVALAAGGNVDLLADQAVATRAPLLATASGRARSVSRDVLGQQPEEGVRRDDRPLAPYVVARPLPRCRWRAAPAGGRAAGGAGR